MDLQLEGRVALVTASSRGIGGAVAARLSAEGAITVAASRTSAHLPVDLADPGATADLVGRVVVQHGRLDAVVINTPGPPITGFLDTTDDDWSAAYDLLLRPAVQLARAAARHMVGQGGGSIVFLTSTWVKQPAAGGVLSASFRSAISALSKSLAAEVAPYGVRVNQVLPGATGTDRMAGIVAAKAARNGTTPDDETAGIVADIPLGRWADPVEIADTVVFLCSPRSGFTTGAAYQVDGGAIRSTL